VPDGGRLAPGSVRSNAGALRSASRLPRVMERRRSSNAASTSCLRAFGDLADGLACVRRHRPHLLQDPREVPLLAGGSWRFRRAKPARSWPGVEATAERRPKRGEGALDRKRDRRRLGRAHRAAIRIAYRRNMRHNRRAMHNRHPPSPTTQVLVPGHTLSAFAAFVVFAAVLSAGCVRRPGYDAEVADATTARTKISAQEAQIAKLQQDLADAQAQNPGTRTEAQRSVDLRAQRAGAARRSHRDQRQAAG